MNLLTGATALPAVLASESSNIPDVPVASTALWIGFVVGLVVVLLIDLLVVNRDGHVPSLRQAIAASAVWIAMGVSFSLVVWQQLGGTAATQYLTAYVVEKSLSVDNVFVWSIILTFFAVPPERQHRVLFWGIFGALVMRIVFILAGIALLERFSFLEILFGAFLVFTAVRIARQDDDHEFQPEKNLALRFTRRIIPVTNEPRGAKFFVRENRRLLATPLFVVLVLVEASDLVFAVDSIPAVLAVTRSNFVAFSSNAAAILGLRALYFVLAGAATRVRYLDEGLAVILAFVGAKMILSRWWHIPTAVSLAVILGVLVVTVLVSRAADRRHPVAADDNVDHIIH